MIRKAFLQGDHSGIGATGEAALDASSMSLGQLSRLRGSRADRLSRIFEAPDWKGKRIVMSGVRTKALVGT